MDTTINSSFPKSRWSLNFYSLSLAFSFFFKLFPPTYFLLSTSISISKHFLYLPYSRCWQTAQTLGHFGICQLRRTCFRWLSLIFAIKRADRLGDLLLNQHLPMSYILYYPGPHSKQKNNNYGPLIAEHQRTTEHVHHTKATTIPCSSWRIAGRAAAGHCLTHKTQQTHCPTGWLASVGGPNDRPPHWAKLNLLRRTHPPLLSGKIYTQRATIENRWRTTTTTSTYTTYFTSVQSENASQGIIIQTLHWIYWRA